VGTNKTAGNQKKIWKIMLKEKEKTCLGAGCNKIGKTGLNAIYQIVFIESEDNL
jgi:hypothetical protein